MGNPQERQAGTSGSATGYGPGEAEAERNQGRSGRAEPEERAGAEAYRRDTGRHAAGEHRGAVVTFTAVAGTLMLLSGLWSVIIGIAAVSSQHVYIHTPASGYTYLWTARGWGWAEIIL